MTLLVTSGFDANNNHHGWKFYSLTYLEEHLTKITLKDIEKKSEGKNYLSG